MSAVRVTHFSKSYGNKNVLHDISFSIQNNVICGILGVNGAGKTTLLECIEGLRPYQQGEITICDLSQKDALKQSKYGVQMQSATLPNVVKVHEIIRLFCDWNNSNQFEELISLFDLKELQNQTYESLSTGQKRKLHLVLSIVNNPEVVFLDEPTAGLDVEARAGLHNMIRSLKEQGKTIVLSSHDMAEVESLCDQIIFLQHKTIYFDGTVEQFKRIKSSDFRVEIKPSNQARTIHYDIKSITKELPTIIADYASKNIDIEEIQINRPSLEDVFLDVASEGKQ